MRGTVRRRGKSWQALVSVIDAETGERRQLSSTHKTREDAEHWLNQTIVRFGLDSRSAHSMKVGDLLERWYQHHAHDLDNVQADVARSIIDQVLVPVLGNKKIVTVGGFDLDKWFLSLRETEDRATIRSYYEILFEAFEMALRYGWLNRNPLLQSQQVKRF